MIIRNFDEGGATHNESAIRRALRRLGSSLPDQTGHAGDFLTTDGTTASWVAASGLGDLLAANNLSDVADAPTSLTNLGGMAALSGMTNDNIATFHNDLIVDSGVSITALSTITSGSYIPTSSASANLDAGPTMQTAIWMRIGDVVVVNGLFSANPTLTATTTSFEIDLPVASDLGLSEDLSGVTTCGTIVSMSGNVVGDEITNTAKFQWKSTDITAQNWTYNFMYRII